MNPNLYTSPAVAVAAFVSLAASLLPHEVRRNTKAMSNAAVLSMYWLYFMLVVFILNDLKLMIVLYAAGFI
jgi:hypothetical protein